MLTRYVKIIGLIAALSVSSGCGTLPQRETMLDRHWGTSLEATKQSQILNPEAGKNLDPVVELDGQAAEASMEKYRGITKVKETPKIDPARFLLDFGF
ncbi:MAG: pilus assembly protein [Proteobacteria bacterium]|nr:pilus assembly protein [Pseudomonadota bacterium]